MGCQRSVPVAAYVIDPGFEKVKGMFVFLGLSDLQIATLHRLFVKKLPEEDPDPGVPPKPQLISIEDALDIVGHPTNTFLRHVFSDLDRKNRGLLSFTQFVVCLWNFCTLDEHSHLATYIFDHYKTTRLGDLELEYDVIDDEHAVKFLMEANHHHLASMTDLYRLLCRGDDSMMKLIFLEFVKGHPQFIQCVTHLQHSITRDIFGSSEWNKLLQFRTTLFHSQFKTTKDIFVLVKVDQKRIAEERRIEEEALSSKSMKHSVDRVAAAVAAANTGQHSPTEYPVGDDGDEDDAKASEYERKMQEEESAINEATIAPNPKQKGRRRKERHSLDSVTRKAPKALAVPSSVESLIESKKFIVEMAPNPAVLAIIEDGKKREDGAGVPIESERRKRRRKARHSFPAETGAADKERDKIVHDVLPRAEASAYGNIGLNFKDVNYRREGFEFDHSAFLSNGGHMDKETKLAYDVKHMAPKQIGNQRKRELGNIGTNMKYS